MQIGIGGAGGLLLAGCQGDQTTSEKAATRREIDAGIGPTLDKLYADVRGSREAAGKSEGLLIFPSVTKVGVGVGGEFGRGALRRGMRTDGYYAFSSGSIGFQLGAERRSIVIMFMTQDALKKFLDSSWWSVGADASYAVPEQGGAAQAATTPKPVVIYIFGATGLMFNASVEGSKIEKLDLT
jgi:lipid-binding SYLF domain-containing protein